MQSVQGAMITGEDSESEYGKEIQNLLVFSNYIVACFRK